MTRSSILPVFTAAALAAATLTTAASRTTADAAAGAAPAATTPLPAPSGGTRFVTLPTGQRFLARPGPEAQRSWELVDKKAGDDAQFLRVGERLVVVPDSVRALVGRVLDPELFDLEAIADRGGSTPVRVVLTPGSRATTVPGVEVRSRNGRNLTGVITARSAADLQRLLARARPAGLYSGIERITVASPPAEPRTKRPSGRSGAAYPMHTLTLKATGLDGKPLDGAELIVVCANDLDRFYSPVTLSGGTAKVSVPTGTYVVMSRQEFGDTDVRFAYSREFAVTGPTTSGIDFRRATTRFIAHTPTRASIQARIVSLDRVYPVGDGHAILSMGVVDDGEHQIRVTPTLTPRYGEQSINEYEWAYGPGGYAGGRYAFYFGHTDGIPAKDIVKVADDTNLATVRTSLYGSARIDAAVFGRTVRPTHATAPWGFGEGAPAPTRFTEYVSAGTDVRSSAYYIADAAGSEARGWIDAHSETMQGGRRYRLDAARGPLHGGFYPINRDTFCSSCTSGDRVTVMGYLGGDSEAGHVGAPDVVEPPTQTWEITADGRRLASGTGLMLGGDASLPAGAKTVGLHMHLDRTGAPFTTSTHIDTTWSAPRTATSPLADGVYCSLESRCRVLDFVSARYDLATDLQGTVRAGRHRMEIALTRPDGSPARGVTTARLRMDYGRGWVNVPVTKVAEGRYAATLTVPASLGAANLDLTVATASGARLHERVTDGFRFRP